MTKICLEQDTNAWFEIDGGGQVHLQILSQEIIKEIRSQVVKKKIDFRRIDGKAERIVYDDINEDLQNELFWDRIILGWKDLYDSNGIPIECTRQNKVLLMNKSQKFLNFIMENLGKLKDLDTQRIEDIEKN